MKRSETKLEAAAMKVPDLDLSCLKGPHPPPPRLTMDQYVEWMLESIANETPQQREWRLNRPMPIGEPFVWKD